MSKKPDCGQLLTFQIVDILRFGNDFIGSKNISDDLPIIHLKILVLGMVL